ncbi:MAG TPA: putative maltokinase [Patescibacteria group bacterium]|nr:putative maltokinase [Patescibacteria group bacterium]
MGSSHLSAWENLQRPLEQRLPGFLSEQRWFGGKTRVIQNVKIADFIPVPLEGAAACILLARVIYEEGVAETYAVPLLESPLESLPERPRGGTDERPKLLVPAEGGERVLTDALWDPGLLAKLLEALASASHLSGARGEMVGLPTPALETLRRAAGTRLEPALLKAEQSNTSILYGRCFVLKFFRHVEEGLNPDFEMGEFLSVRAGFPCVPATAGCFEYRRPGAQPATMGILQAYVANRGDAWRRTLAALDGFYGRVESSGPAELPGERPGRGLVAQARRPSEAAALWLGEYREAAYKLGRRTGELHLALSSDTNDPEFRPEPFSPDEQREVSESMIRLAEQALGMLGRRAAELPAALGGKIRAALAAEGEILGRFELLRERRLTGLRTRIHGDLHLGQILDTGDDFVFIDFEGEPARSLAERRAKHSPVRDVAGMLRSFHYAAYAALFGRVGDAGAADPRFAALSGFADGWRRWASVEFLRGYLEAAEGAAFLPTGTGELEFFLNLWLLDKAMYELKYELNHRPGWVAIPLEGICDLAEKASPAPSRRFRSEDD